MRSSPNGPELQRIQRIHRANNRHDERYKLMTETGAKRVVGLSTWAAIWFDSIGILAGIVAYRMISGFTWGETKVR